MSKNKKIIYGILIGFTLLTTLFIILLFSSPTTIGPIEPKQITAEEAINLIAQNYSKIIEARGNADIPQENIKQTAIGWKIDIFWGLCPDCHCVFEVNHNGSIKVLEQGETSSLCEPSAPSERGLKDCSKNSDCIKVLANPCTAALEICKAMAINKNYKTYWDDLLADCADAGVACQETEPGDATFTMDPECINQRCELTKQRPYTVSPQCGTATTDNLISFGWFPVDYESKHLIQIDNNSNFSSLEIEAYETASGIFTPASPMTNGTYYWRVKSTKLEKEKCLPPACAPSSDPNDPCNISIENYKQCKVQYSRWSDVCTFTILPDLE